MFDRETWFTSTIREQTPRTNRDCKLLKRVWKLTRGAWWHFPRLSFVTGVENGRNGSQGKTQGKVAVGGSEMANIWTAMRIHNAAWHWLQLDDSPQHYVTPRVTMLRVKNHGWLATPPPLIFPHPELIPKRDFLNTVRFGRRFFNLTLRLINCISSVSFLFNIFVKIVII